MKFRFSILVLTSTVLAAGFAVSAAAQAPVSDADAVKFRGAASIPYDANRSGTCMLRYDVTKEGRTENIKALRCTESLFARNSVKAVSRFLYEPADYRRTDVETKITFRLLDERGKLTVALPMPERVDAPDSPAKIRNNGKLKLMKDKRKQDDNYCCINHDVDNRGRAFNIAFGTCKDYDLGRSAWRNHLKHVIRFTPAEHDAEKVVSGPYDTLFWSRGSKVYLGNAVDARRLCTVSGE